MEKQFDINTVTILGTIVPITGRQWYIEEHFTVKAQYKYIGGKRWKRGKISINKQQLRQIKINNVV